jgi:protocatechuate 3,4-dioxygenase, alpha subunit
MALPRTPSQTVGPFFSFGLCTRPMNELVAPDSERAVEVRGRVLDGDEQPVPDALLEVWQQGLGAGFGRCGTDDRGEYRFVIAPPHPVEGQAPHLAVLVFARGLLKPLLTRLYMPDDPANASDPVLTGLPDDEARTMIALREGDRLRFDIHLQGERQTAFFGVGGGS